MSVDTALLVSNLLLWVLVVALAALVLALVRQIGVLHERVAPAGALLLGRGARPGEAAPEMELEDLAGRSHAVGGRDPEGRSTLIVFVSPVCPVCKALLPVIRSIARHEGGALRVLLASDGPRREHEAFVRDHDLEGFPYLVSAELGVACGVARLPWAVLIDADGVLRAQGLVSSREHLESLFEAQAHGVASVQEFLARAQPREEAG